VVAEYVQRRADEDGLDAIARVPPSADDGAQC